MYNELFKFYNLKNNIFNAIITKYKIKKFVNYKI